MTNKGDTHIHMATKKLPICMLLICTCAALFSCSKNSGENDGSENFDELYGGAPYKGPVTLRYTEGETSNEWSGDGRIVFIEATGDSISLVVMADFDAVGELNLKLRGAHGGNRFTAKNENIDFQINNQSIRGEITNQVQEMAFDGMLKRDKSSLSMSVTYLKEQDGFPAGANLLFNFDTARDVSENTEGCTLRMVPVWGPSGMTMGMVPDC